MGEPPSILQPIQALIDIFSLGLPLLSSSVMKSCWIFAPIRIESFILSISGKDML